MNNKIVGILLALPFVLVCSWAMYYANFVSHAEDVTLPIRGYDPRNILSGHYIQFQIDWDIANCHQSDWNGICPRNEFKGINRYYVPENKAKSIERAINRTNQGVGLVYFPVGEHVNSDLAMLSQTSRAAAEIVFAYKKGKRPIAKDLLINGIWVG